MARRNKIWAKLIAHKILVITIAVLAVGVVAAAYTSQIDAPNQVFEGDCVNCDLSSADQREQKAEEVTLGAISGPDIYWDTNIYGTFTYGSSKYDATTTTATAYTMKIKDLLNYTYIDLMCNTAATTLTLPATSSMMQLLPEIGSTREWLIHNATSTSGITLTLGAGAGMDLVGVSNATDVIDPGEWTRLTCTQIHYRTADNENVMCIVDELENSD